MPRKSPYSIRLSRDDKSQLSEVARKYTSSYIDVIRAKIILYAAQGMSNDEIGKKLDTPRQVVSKWRKRFFEQGPEGLQELPRRGRPARFSPQRRSGG